MGAQLPPFKTTPVEQISGTVDVLRKTFFVRKTRDVQFRIKQLRKLYWAIEDNKDLIVEACKKDLGKGFFEAMIAEVAWVQNDIIFMTNNLEKWCKDESAQDIELANKFMRPKIRKDPLGIVLVIGYVTAHHGKLQLTMIVLSIFPSNSLLVL